jgi:hypothetical protein
MNRLGRALRISKTTCTLANRHSKADRTLVDGLPCQ